MKISGLFIYITVILMVFGITATASSSTTGGLIVDWFAGDGANLTNVPNATVAANKITWDKAMQWDGGSTNLVAATARNNLGLGSDIIYESVTGNIQADIDAMAANTSIHKLIVTGDHTLSNILIHGDTKYIEFLGTITASPNTAAFIIGNAGNSFKNSDMKVNKIIGNAWESGTTEGIKVQNAVRSNFHFNNISTVKYAIDISSLSFVNDNTFIFSEIVWVYKGVFYDSNMAENAEGNKFYGSIFGCSIVCFEINNGGGKSSKYAAYYGVIDNVLYSSSKDIIDTTGSNMYYLTFIQDSLSSAKNSIHNDSIVIELGSVRMFFVNPIIKSVYNPTLSFINATNRYGFSAYINSNLSGDFNIIQTKNNGEYNRTDIAINNSTGQTIIQSPFNNNVLKLMDSDGACEHNPGSGSEVVTCSSDRKLKKDIQIENTTIVLNRIKNIPLKNYIVIASNESTMGVIAQEYQELYPTKVHNITNTRFVGMKNRSEVKYIRYWNSSKKSIDTRSEITNYSEPVFNTTTELGVELPSIWEVIAVNQALINRTEVLNDKLNALELRIQALERNKQ